MRGKVCNAPYENPRGKAAAQVLCLLVRDEPAATCWVARTLLGEGVAFETVAEPKGGALLVSVASTGAELVAWCRALRATLPRSAVMLAGPVDTSRAATLLDLGFDDVLRLPMEAGELGARVRARLRNAVRPRGLRVWVDGRFFCTDGVETMLTPNQAKLAGVLLAASGAVECAVLVREVFGVHAGGRPRLRQLVYELRHRGLPIECAGGAYRLVRDSCPATSP